MWESFIMVVGEVGLAMTQNTNTDDRRTVEKDGVEYEFTRNATFGVWEYDGENVSEVPLDVFYAFRDAGITTAVLQGAREKVAERFSEKYDDHVPFEVGSRNQFDVGDEWTVREETKVTHCGVEFPIIAFQQA